MVYKNSLQALSTASLEYPAACDSDRLLLYPLLSSEGLGFIIPTGFFLETTTKWRVPCRLFNWRLEIRAILQISGKAKHDITT